MQERIVTIRNRAGIHCRPSGVILNAIHQAFPDHLIEVVTADGSVTEINSILALISLDLACGISATLRIEGVDEERAIREIGDLFEKVYDFPPRVSK